MSRGVPVFRFGEDRVLQSVDADLAESESTFDCYRIMMMMMSPTNWNPPVAVGQATESFNVTHRIRLRLLRSRLEWHKAQ